MRDSCGSSGTDETSAGEPRRLIARPTEKRASWSGNRRITFLIATKFTKTAILKKLQAARSFYFSLIT